MCGIFAWAGRNPATFDPYKFNVLGIWNETRGKHSCGVTTDGGIYIGIDKNKMYRDFIVNSGYPNPKSLPSVIGHTRQATFGAHNEYNAHPFGFGRNKKLGQYANQFVGVHNGSLVNHEELAKKYGVPIKTKYKKGNAKYERSKIDSEILLNIIYKEGNFNVLSEYIGAAALIFVDTHDPNVIYMYHGASRDYDYKHATTYEERPLWYYQESKYSAYASSIKESLQTIGAVEKENLFEFKHNYVYKIKNGDILNAELIKIDRTACYQKKISASSGRYGSYYDDDYYGVGYGFQNKNKNKDDKSFHLPAASGNSKDIKITTYENNIHKEEVKPIKGESDVYYEGLRFKRNGLCVYGVYVFIPSYGYMFLSKEIKKAEDIFWSFTNRPFLDNTFLSQDQFNKITDEDELERIIFPFEHEPGNEIINPPFKYLFNGVALKNEMDYQICSDFLSRNEFISTEQLSAMSKYPICDVTGGGKGDKQGVIKEGNLYSGGCAPLGSQKVYFFRKGNLVNTMPIPQTYLLPSSNKTIDINKINATVEDMKESEIIEKLGELLLPSYEKFPVLVKQLEKDYPNSDSSKEVVKLLKEFNQKINGILKLEANEVNK